MSAIVSSQFNPQVEQGVTAVGKDITMDNKDNNSDHDIAPFYHSLPSLEDALKTLTKVDFDEVLAKVTDLLAPYGDRFGLSLVHRHFDIFNNELMVEDGIVMKPFLKDDLTEFFEKRWDRNGHAYEYSTTKQAPVPEALLKQFRELVPDSTSLGIYSRLGDDETNEWMETTHPDDRLHLDIPKTAEYVDAPETAWYSKDGAPLTRGCGKTCTSSAVKNGKEYKHVTTVHPKK